MSPLAVAYCERCGLDFPARDLLEDGHCYGCSVNADRERRSRLDGSRLLLDGWQFPVDLD